MEVFTAPAAERESELSPKRILPAANSSLWNLLSLSVPDKNAVRGRGWEERTQRVSEVTKIF